MEVDDCFYGEFPLFEDCKQTNICTYASYLVPIENLGKED